MSFVVLSRIAQTVLACPESTELALYLFIPPQEGGIRAQRRCLPSALH